MGCEGCYSEQKAVEQSIFDIQLKAKKFAIENETKVFIYKNEFGEPQYMAEQSARELGIAPTLGIVLPL